MWSILFVRCDANFIDTALHAEVNFSEMHARTHRESFCYDAFAETRKDQQRTHGVYAFLMIRSHHTTTNILQIDEAVATRSDKSISE